jgi:hypothetical protein
MMTSVPTKLFEKAIACKLACLPSEQGNHCIQPQGPAARWYLVYRNGHWVLIVNGVPQIQFSYDEALKFLDRFSQDTESSQGREISVVTAKVMARDLSSITYSKMS